MSAGGIEGEHVVGSLGGTSALDLAVVRSVGAAQEFALSIWRGAGDGTFARQQELEHFFAYGAHVVGRFRGGAQDDVVVSGRPSDSPTAPGVLFMSAYDSATGQHQPMVTIGLPVGYYFSKLVAGNFDSQGGIDVVGVQPSGSALFLHNDGTSLVLPMPPRPAFSMGPSPRSVLALDLNDDGKLDLVSAGPDRLTLREGNGDGSFGAMATLLYSNLDNDDVIAGDFNGDGVGDLAVTSTDTNDVTVFLNGSTPRLIIRGTHGPGVNDATFTWPAQGTTSTYNVNRGDLFSLARTNRDTRDATCLPPTGRMMPTFTDSTPAPAPPPPPPNFYRAFYYLVSCTGPECTETGFGSDFFGAARVVGAGACP
jgi:hypothetical protein